MRSPEDAAEWVRQSLPEKNRLRASDATQVEATFEAKLAQITAFRAAGATTQAANAVQQPASPTSEVDLQSDELRGPFRQGAIDKGVLALPEPRRIRDRDHVRLVATRPCLVCGRLPSDPHHLRFAQSRALSCKVSDEFTVPLCRGHHRELHRYGDEAIWWSRLGIDVLQVARALWLESHPLPITLEVTAGDFDSGFSSTRSRIGCSEDTLNSEGMTIRKRTRPPSRLAALSERVCGADGDRKTPLRPMIIVLDSLDIVLAEVAAGLHFDEFEIDLAGIFQAVPGAARHVDRFIFV